jgi:putative nucleotidyltransferase with HDIG domain
MGFSESPYLILILFAALICLMLAVFVGQNHRKTSGAVPLSFLLLGITEWLVAYALELESADPAGSMFWAKIEYLGIVSVPLAIFIYAVNHAGLQRWLTVRRLLIFSAIPVITLGLAYTNQAHGLIWAQYTVTHENGLMLSTKIYGAWFWVHSIYSYSLLLAASILIFRTVFLSNSLYKWQGIALMLGIVAPWAGNVLYILHINLLGGLDLTPICFAFTGFMLSLAITRLKLGDILPVARDRVISGMDDGLLVLDSHDRIVDMNPMSQKILSVDFSKAVGKKLKQILPEQLLLGEKLKNGGEKRFELTLIKDNENRYYECSNAPVFDRSGAVNGSILLLHDSTERRRIEEKLLETERKLRVVELEKAEKALHESERRYRNIFESAAVSIWEEDCSELQKAIENLKAEGIENFREYLEINPLFIFKAANMVKVLDVNRQSLKMFDADNKNELLASVHSLFSPNSLDIFKEQVLAIADGKQYLESEAVLQTLHGTRLNVLMATNFQALNSGRVLLSITDISELKTAQDALSRSYDTLQHTFERTVQALASAVEARDPYTAGHQRQVTRLALAIAEDMGLTKEQKNTLRFAGILHDVGKIYVPAEILCKPGALTETEFSLIKLHPEAGFQIVKNIEFPWPVAETIRQHHERLNGSGYPRGLLGNQILIEAKVLAVADVVEAIAGHRPYRPSLGIDRALDEVMRNKGILYDVEITEICNRLFKEKGFQLAQVLMESAFDAMLVR